jgi:hypothetical protein
MRRPLLSGLIGLAVTAILAVGLLAVVVSRQTHSGSSNGSGPATGIAWQPVVKGPAVQFTFGPYLASAGSRLYMVGSTPAAGADYSTEVWSSADGTTWDRMSDAGAFEPGFAAFWMSNDGNGGLILVGSSGSSGSSIGEARTPEAWHSPDGRTWTRADLGAEIGGELMRVAARPGAVVALGDWRIPASGMVTGSDQVATGLYAWFSADGSAWGRADLPDSADYVPTAVTAWTGGFVAVADKSTAGSTSSIWTSADGRTWEKAPMNLAGFGSDAIAALGDRVVTVGSKPDSKLGIVPASWSSTDGKTWVQATAATRDPAFLFDDVTAVDGTLVAIGSSRMADPLVAGGATAPPTPSEGVWISGDGMTWQLLDEDSSLKLNLNTHIASIGGRVVVATQDVSSVDIYAGNLTR